MKTTFLHSGYGRKKALCKYDVVCYLGSLSSRRRLSVLKLGYFIYHVFIEQLSRKRALSRRVERCCQLSSLQECSQGLPDWSCSAPSAKAWDAPKNCGTAITNSLPGRSVHTNKKATRLARGASLFLGAGVSAQEAGQQSGRLQVRAQELEADLVFAAAEDAIHDAGAHLHRRHLAIDEQV